MPRLPRDTAIGFVLVLCVSIGLVASHSFRSMDWSVYDLQTRWLRAQAPTRLAQDVVVIGIDEAAFEAIAEPYALWHRQMGALLQALAVARPAVVGLAVPLPVRSYEFLIPGIDAPLLDGVRRVRAVAPLVLGQSTGLGQQLRPIAPELVNAAGKDAIASLVLCEDADGVVRSLRATRCVAGDGNPPFAQSLAQALGREGALTGLIHYSAGPDVEYLPLMTVLHWIRDGQQAQLNARVGGRAVVVANLLPSDARHRLPAAIAAWDRGNRSAPDALVHIQALRSLLGPGLIEPASGLLLWAMLGCSVLLWFGRNRRGKLLLFATFVLAVGTGSTYLLWQGVAVPIATVLGVGALAYVTRLMLDSVRHYRERQLLRTAFAGHVSPQTMRAILGGRLQPDGAGDRCQVTVLFADIRGFTTRSEKSTPEETIALLNRYYAQVSAAIHGRGGAIDKFIGDGVMATFGVPQPLPAPERNAFEAAQDMLVRVERLNATLVAQGQEPIEIGIGIQTGDVLAGYVGSRKRRDFTVIGDAVNTASRLEGMSKTLGYPVICSHAVASAVGLSGGLVDLGLQAVKGRSDVHVYGWAPELYQRVKKGVR